MWNLHADRAESALGRRNEFLAALQRECGRIDVNRFVAEVIFTELVGNVIRHAPGPVDLQLSCENGDAVLSVFDHGEGFRLRPSLPAEPLADHGRGLFLVSRFAKDLHVASLARHGSCVSATFPV